MTNPNVLGKIMLDFFLTHWHKLENNFTASINLP